MFKEQKISNSVGGITLPYILNGKIFKVIHTNGEEVAAQCLYCESGGIYKGHFKSTGNFHLHIKRKHPELKIKVKQMKVDSINLRRNFNRNKRISYVVDNNGVVYKKSKFELNTSKNNQINTTIESKIQTTKILKTQTTNKLSPVTRAKLAAAAASQAIPSTSTSIMDSPLSLITSPTTEISNSDFNSKRKLKSKLKKFNKNINLTPIIPSTSTVPVSIATTTANISSIKDEANSGRIKIIPPKKCEINSENLMQTSFQTLSPSTLLQSSSCKMSLEEQSVQSASDSKHYYQQSLPLLSSSSSSLLLPQQTTTIKTLPSTTTTTTAATPVAIDYSTQYRFFPGAASDNNSFHNHDNTITYAGPYEHQLNSIYNNNTSTNNINNSSNTISNTTNTSINLTTTSNNNYSSVNTINSTNSNIINTNPNNISLASITDGNNVLTRIQTTLKGIERELQIRNHLEYQKIVWDASRFGLLYSSFNMNTINNNDNNYNN